MLAQMRATSKEGAQVLDALAREEIRVSFVTRGEAPEHWVLRAIFPRRLNERYGLGFADIVVADAPLSRRALHTLAGAPGTIDVADDYVLVFTDAPPWLSSSSLPIREHLLSIRWDTVQSFERALQSALPSTDPFDQRSPIPRITALQPRSVLAHSVTEELLGGGSIGLYGLRKSGKSSVALTVAEGLRNDDADGLVGSADADRNITAFVDVQSLLVRTVDALATSIVDAMRAQISVAPESSPLVALDRALRSTAALQQRACIILDEYDLLFAGVRGRRAVEGVEAFFGLLRAHAQRTGLVSLLLVGRDPRWATQPLMEGHPNPLLGWLKTNWVAPLSKASASGLLKTLARRCCLTLGEATAAAAWEWSGGHVMLLRRFGSVARTVSHRASPRQLVGAETDRLLGRIVDAFVEHDAVQEICREVEQLLAATAPDAASLFWEIASSSESSASIVERSGGRSSPAMRTLRNFGLVLEDGDEVVVPEIWRWWSRFVTTTNIESAS